MSHTAQTCQTLGCTPETVSKFHTTTWELYDQLHAERVRAEIEEADAALDMAIVEALNCGEADYADKQMVNMAVAAVETAYNRLSSALDLLP